MKLFLLLLLTWTVDCSKILGIFPTPNPDYVATGSRLMSELVKNGHTVTFVTAPNMEKHLNKDLNYVFIDNELNVLKNLNSTFMDRIDMGFARSISHYYTTAYDVTESLLSETSLQSLLQSNQNFDLVIAEYSANEAILGIARTFRSPIILVSPFPSSIIMTDLFANPAPASYVPNIFTEHTGFMSYFGRMHNLLCNVYIENYRNLYSLRSQEKLLNKYISTQMDLENVMEDVSLIFLNSHASITEPVPHTPNMIEVGGLHITLPKKLPQIIEEFIDNAEHGVVYITFDPNLNADNLGFYKMDVILTTLNRFKQRFIWNFDSRSSIQPDNVMFVDDIRHQDIIGHFNIRAVITDGNLFRIMEAIHFGVPIIGIPLFADQKSNMARVVEGRYGIEIDFDDLATDKFNKAIVDIFENKIFAANAKSRSAVMNDQLVSPIDTAVYWTEYVIRHDGADHFQSPGVHLPRYKRRLIDIIIVLIIIDVALFLMFYYIIKHIIHTSVKKYKARKAKNYDQLNEDSEK